MASPPAKRPKWTLANPPSIDAAIYTNMGRYHGAVVGAVFENMGGIPRMTEWAQENPGEFYKSIFAKTISTPKEVNVTGTLKIEDAVKALDLEEGTGYTVVEDAEINEEDE